MSPVVPRLPKKYELQQGSGPIEDALFLTYRDP